MRRVLTNMRSKKGALVALAIFAAVLVGTYVFKDKASDGSDVLAAYDAAMAADRVGGATPQETLSLFIAALRAGDPAAAAQYFMLDDNLSRAMWVRQLNDVKRRGLLGKMADDI